jgi:protoporphyrinogen oxidase
MSKITVIGAGPMGLTVAYDLLKQGHSVTVYEADDVIGGMSASFDFDGLRIERYYHFICASDQPLFDMLTELGIRHTLRWTDTKMGFYYDGRLYDWSTPIGLLKFPELDIVSKLRYGLLAFSLTNRSDWSELDRVEAVSWIKQRVGEKAYDVLWKSLFELKFYDYVDDLSAAWIGARIRRVGKSRNNIMVERMGYLEGGSDTLLYRMKDAIEEMGGGIELGAPIQKVLIEDGRVEGVRVLADEVACDQVVSTAPLPYVPWMMPDLPEEILERLRSVDNIAVVCVLAKLKKRFTENFWLNINDKRIDIPGFVEQSNLRPLEDHVVYAPYYMPGDHEKFSEGDEAFIDKVCSFLRMINPELSDDDITAVRVFRYRFAQPICGPEFLSKLPPIDLPIEGLFVADTSYYYPEDRTISESVNLAHRIAGMIGRAQ